MPRKTTITAEERSAIGRSNRSKLDKPKPPSKAADIEERKRQIFESFSKGERSFPDTVAFFAKKFDLSKNTISEYLRDALKEAYSDEYRQSVKESLLARVEQLYISALSEGDKQTARLCLDQLAKLEAMYKERVEANVNAEVTVEL